MIRSLRLLCEASVGLTLIAACISMLVNGPSECIDTFDGSQRAGLIALGMFLLTLSLLVIQDERTR
jgi:hypothetical protein